MVIQTMDRGVQQRETGSESLLVRIQVLVNMGAQMNRPLKGLLLGAVLRHPVTEPDSADWICLRVRMGKRRDRLALRRPSVTSRAAILLVLSCALVDGCSNAGSAAGSGSLAAGPTGGNCKTFTLPTDNPNPHGNTPREALQAFFSGGSIFGAAPPSVSPSRAGLPITGWQEADPTTSGRVTFRSGKAQLVFTKVDGSSWVVTSGYDC